MFGGTLRKGMPRQPEEILRLVPACGLHSLRMTGVGLPSYCVLSARKGPGRPRMTAIRLLQVAHMRAILPNSTAGLHGHDGRLLAAARFCQ